MQEVMADNPKWIVEEEMVKGIVHPGHHGLRCEKADIDHVPEREQNQGNVGRDGAPKKGSADHFKFTAVFFIDSGVNNEMGGDGIHNDIQ